MNYSVFLPEGCGVVGGEVRVAVCSVVVRGVVSVCVCSVEEVLNLGEVEGDFQVCILCGR